MKQGTRWALLACGLLGRLALLAPSHCGYRSLLPSSQASQIPLIVMPLRERSTIVGIAPHLTANLRHELAAHGFALQEPGEGAVLTGDITLTEQGIQSAAGIRLFRLQVRYRMQLQRGDEPLLWQGEGAEQEDYLLTTAAISQPILTESNRRMALLRVGEKLAQHITSQLLAHFATADTSAQNESSPPGQQPAELPAPPNGNDPQEAITPAE